MLSKRRNVKQRASTTLHQSSRRESEVAGQKVTVCLTLFLLAFLAVGFLGLWSSAPLRSSPDPVALQLNPKDLCPAVAQDASAKTAVLEDLQWDSSSFIPAYTVLFIALGLAVFSGRSPTWIYGLGIVLLSILAAGSDLLENHYLESCLDGNYLAASLARKWSLTKWRLLSFATVAAAPVFLVRNDWTKNIGYILASLGIPGLLLLVPLNLAYPIVSYLLLPPLGLGLALSSITFVIDLINPNSRATHWR